MAVVTCLYDTGFSSLKRQIKARVKQIANALDDIPLLSWLFLLVDDGPGDQSDEIAAALKACQDTLKIKQGTLECIPLFPNGRPRNKRDRKGWAIRHGFQHLITEQPGWDALTYINLNLKVDMAQLPTVLKPVLFHECDVAIGTRSPGEGGCVLGAGFAGRLKSVVYNSLATSALPPLKPYADTNAPVKIGSEAAIRHLLDVARVEDVSFDTEWVLAFLEGGFEIETIGVIWSQLKGSRPPWTSVPKVLLSLVDQRRRWLRRQFRGKKRRLHRSAARTTSS
ncbi:MAG: hypothetical protein P1V97_30580 [Planctomycetota bacterium]|nr:hypothetical protein [Planctomycetota bacterium]